MNMSYLFAGVFLNTLIGIAGEMFYLPSPVQTSVRFSLIPSQSGGPSTFYIAPDGDDTNPGTIDKPFKSWDRILPLVKPGDTVYLRGGTYYAAPFKPNGAFLKGKNGSPGKRIKFWAYPGEIPVLDCSKMQMITNLSGVEFSGDYWHFRGIEVKNVPQPVNAFTHQGLFCVGFSAQGCNHNIFENINVHDNGCIGFYLGGESTDNLALNCDFHDNYDPYSYASDGKLYDGGNADGAHITLSNKNKDAVNTFKGCRSWSNSDDGFDTWGTESIIYFDSCWAFRNGYKPGTTIPKGDGQGFKLGITNDPPNGTFHKIVRYCLAFENREHGFDQSDAHCLMLFENNIAYKNKGLGFYIAKFNLKNSFRNNIAIANSIDRTDKITQVSITKETDTFNNSWTSKKFNTTFFRSTNDQGADQNRKPDGALPDIPFLKLKAGSLGIID